VGNLLAIAISLPLVLEGAPAQVRPTRSVADYVCAFSGRCVGNQIQAFSLGQSQEVDLRLSFNSGSTQLTPQGAAEAEVFAAALKSPALARSRFRIEGHTDSVGSRASNLLLSRARAEAVVAFLARRGVQRNRLVARGYGFDQPLAGRPASAPANRRVEAHVIR
jgi:outer membrane protein OmpA-like peptidoglycan-associated protein